ncbi:MAG: DNA polymerase IV [Ignavibacteriales bacterium]|nr:DNA polymerase IV [Ignavibacteriales bacterium]MCB9209635.1 DNA polymerase IV [Ignavibacteriales bacterium]
MRTIFHLDLDSFFVSVERILDPSLKGKPVIVGANPEFGRGVVAACSYEARDYGLHSGMPINQAYKLCPNGIYIHGSHGEYSQYSKAVKKILEQYAPLIEQASVDEFYMDFTGTKNLYGSMYMLAVKIQKEIENKLLLPCSIGIGSNKTIAKICSDYAKPKGVTYIIPGMEKEFLAPLPVETIPGVGKKTLPNLHLKGIYKIGDIAKLSEDYFIAAFGKYGTVLWEKANGGGSEYLNPPTERKSISKERTYGKDENNRKEIEQTLFKLTGQVCQLIRDKNWQTSTISIKLRYSDFVTLTRAKTIKPTDDDKTIFDTAVKLLHKADTRRVSIRLIGIHLTKFSEFAQQEEIFEDEDIKRKKMFRAITKIRDKFGYSSIQFGGKLTNKRNVEAHYFGMR